MYEFFSWATNHFNPGKQRDGEPASIFKGGSDTWNIDDKSYFPYTPEKDFYSTDYFTKSAISYLEECKNDSKLFFLYLAFTAPHDPLMAWPEDIAKYRGKYKVGYKAIRDARYKKMLELGMVDPSMKLSEQTAIEWESLTDEEKDQEDLRMSKYAAMIDRIDQSIGKLLKKLDETGKLDNTLILFASDNGANAEDYESKIKNYNGNGEAGTVDYWASLTENWDNVSNTPYRYYKNWSYEGGICTPFIVWWQKIIKQKSIVNNQPLHFVYIMAIFKDLTGAFYPTYFRNQEIVPMQGESFLPALKGGKLKEREKPIFWQWAKGKAIRVGNWKAVAQKDVWSLNDCSFAGALSKAYKSTARKNIFVHYYPRINEIESSYGCFTRNKNYKYYWDGRFYDMVKDKWEKSPLDMHNLNALQQKNYNELKTELSTKKIWDFSKVEALMKSDGKMIKSQKKEKQED